MSHVPKLRFKEFSGAGHAWLAIFNPTPSRFNPCARYAGDPCGYAREVLGVEWWGKQQEIAQALLRPPYKVLVKASHKVGKTHLAGGLVNWWYDVFDPGLALTTAPTDLGVRDLL